MRGWARTSYERAQKERTWALLCPYWDRGRVGDGMYGPQHGDKEPSDAHPARDGVSDTGTDPVDTHRRLRPRHGDPGDADRL